MLLSALKAEDSGQPKLAERRRQQAADLQPGAEVARMLTERPE